MHEYRYTKCITSIHVIPGSCLAMKTLLPSTSQKLFDVFRGTALRLDKFGLVLYIGPSRKQLADLPADSSTGQTQVVGGQGTGTG
jgi:hypothetical protein